MVSRKLVAGAVILAVPIALCATYRPDRAIRVATGFVAHTVCAKIFVSGLDPQTVLSETTDRAGIRRLRWALGYHVDRAAKPSMRQRQGYSAAAPRFTRSSAASCCTNPMHPTCSRATSTR
jgi:hypothetical protein